MIGAKSDAIVQKLQEHRAKKLSLRPSSGGAAAEDKQEQDGAAEAGKLGRNLAGSEVELQYEGGDGGEVELPEKDAVESGRASEADALRSRREPVEFEGGAPSPGSPRRRNTISGGSGK